MFRVQSRNDVGFSAHAISLIYLNVNCGKEFNKCLCVSFRLDGCRDTKPKNLLYFDLILFICEVNRNVQRLDTCPESAAHLVRSAAHLGCVQNPQFCANVVRMCKLLQRTCTRSGFNITKIPCVWTCVMMRDIA